MENQNLFELRIDAEISSYLGQTARWSKFLAIVGFVGCAFFLLFAVAGLFLSTAITAATATPGMMTPAISGGMLTVMYLTYAVIWFFPCLFLYRFATQMQSALSSVDQNAFAQSQANLKSCFKFMGVLTIISLCFVVLGLVIGIGSVAFLAAGS